MSMDELLSCPFCQDGGDPYTDTNVCKLDEAYYWISARVGCRQCGVGFDLFGNIPAGPTRRRRPTNCCPPLVFKWNRRATRPRQAKRKQGRKQPCRRPT